MHIPTHIDTHQQKTPCQIYGPAERVVSTLEQIFERNTQIEYLRGLSTEELVAANNMLYINIVNRVPLVIRPGEATLEGLIVKAIGEKIKQKEGDIVILTTIKAYYSDATSWRHINYIGILGKKQYHY